MQAPLDTTSCMMHAPDLLIGAKGYPFHSTFGRATIARYGRGAT